MPPAFTPGHNDMDGFMPIDPDNTDFQQGYRDFMNRAHVTMEGWPRLPATGSTAATEQCSALTSGIGQFSIYITLLDHQENE